MHMTKSDWQDTMIGIIGLVAALTALYVALRPSSKEILPTTLIEPDNPQGYTGSVGSGSPPVQQYTGEQIAASPYGAAPAFPSATITPASGGNIILPPLQDEGLTVPALAPIHNNFEFCSSCG